MRRLPEQEIQRTVIQHLSLRAAPGVFAFHPANGGWRMPTEAAIFKGLGVVAGVPDLIIIKQGAIYGLELKSEGGRITAVQQATMKAMADAGCTCAVAYGLDAAIRVLEGWGILRGTISGGLL